MSSIYLSSGDDATSRFTDAATLLVLDPVNWSNAALSPISCMHWLRDRRQMCGRPFLTTGRLPLAGLLLVSIEGPDQGESMQNDEREIRQLVATWMEATRAGDIETVLSLMADDVVFLLPGRPPMIGKSAFAAAAQAQSAHGPPRFDGTSEIQEVMVSGEWAFMWTKLTVVVTPSGGAPSITRAGNTLSVLKKQNGKWVLARDANMLSPVSASGK
jgi:uncharacterized protein (TIGR02246 family)